MADRNRMSPAAGLSYCQDENGRTGRNFNDSHGKAEKLRSFAQVADGCLQMNGGMGLMNEMKISRLYRDPRLISIGGRASDV